MQKYTNTYVYIEWKSKYMCLFSFGRTDRKKKTEAKKTSIFTIDNTHSQIPLLT